MESEEEDTFRPWGTWALTFANIFVFFRMNSAGVSALLADADALRAFGGVDATLVWQGEVWRLLTACFVHGAIWHIGLNLWVLLQVGRILERVVGPSRIILIYLISGVSGFAASLLTRPGLTVGASGAIFGIVGALIALAVVTRKHEMGRVLMGALAPFVIATFVIGYWLDFVDNGAHFGGLIAGFLLGYGFLADEPLLMLTLDDDPEGPLSVKRTVGRSQTRGSAIALIAIGVAFTVLVPYSAFQYWNPKWATSKAWASLARGDDAAAKKSRDRAIELAPQNPEVLLLSARLAAADDAKSLYDRSFAAFDKDARTALSNAWSTNLDEISRTGLCLSALEVARSDHEVLNNCAWHWLTSKNLHERHPARALALAQRARDLYAKSDGTFTVEPHVALSYQHTLAIAWSDNGDNDEAIAILQRVLAQDLGAGWFSSRDVFIAKELKRLQDLAALKKLAADRASSTDASSPNASSTDASSTDATRTESAKKEQSAPKPAKVVEDTEQNLGAGGDRDGGTE